MSAAISLGRVLLNLHRLGAQLHPKANARNIRHRSAILLLGLSNLAELRDWYAISDNPRLSRVLQRFPQMHGALYWPYIHNAWPMAHRLRVIDGHYRLLDGRASLLAEAAERLVVLATLDDVFPGLRIGLDKAIWFLREGEIVLSLFIGDERIYSLAFSIGHQGDERVFYVGALQGSNVDGALEKYRELTRALHGMRPRDLLLTACKLLAQAVGADKILAVSTDAQAHKGAYFGDSHRDKLLVNYDEIWVEHHGVCRPDGFFDIPLAVRYRSAEEIPARKRAMYRRRYEMLDALSGVVQRACGGEGRP